MKLSSKDRLNLDLDITTDDVQIYLEISIKNKQMIESVMECLKDFIIEEEEDDV